MDKSLAKNDWNILTQEIAIGPPIMPPSAPLIMSSCLLEPRILLWNLFPLLENIDTLILTFWYHQTTVSFFHRKTQNTMMCIQEVASHCVLWYLCFLFNCSLAYTALLKEWRFSDCYERSTVIKAVIRDSLWKTAQVRLSSKKNCANIWPNTSFHQRQF